MSDIIPGTEGRKVPSPLWGIYSVWRRHALVYRRTWLVNFLPPATEPIFYLLSFGFGLAGVIGTFKVGDTPVPYLQYIGPAMVAVGICFQSFFEGAFGTFIRLRFQKTWFSLLTAPLGFREIFVGEWLWAATRGAIAGLMTALVTLVLGLVSPLGLLAMLPFILIGSLLFAGLGIWMAGLVKTIDQLNVPVFLFMIPMFTLSGTFFPRENLPPVVTAITEWLPLSQLVDLMRMPLAVQPDWPIDILGLLFWTALGTLLAARRIRQQIFK